MKLRACMLDSIARALAHVARAIHAPLSTKTASPCASGLVVNAIVGHGRTLWLAVPDSKQRLHAIAYA